MSKLEVDSNKWSKASLQVLHRLWSGHGASVHAQQEVQAVLSISQVCPSTNKENQSYLFLKYFVVTLNKFFFSHFVLSFQLVDMQWKLGMAVSSDTCRSLNSPYVSLRLKILEPSGQICHKSFEMTVPQFQVLMLQCSRSVISVVT